MIAAAALARFCGANFPEPDRKDYVMKKLVNTALFILFTVISAAVLAEIRTVTLAVSGMT